MSTPRPINTIRLIVLALIILPGSVIVWRYTRPHGTVPVSPSRVVAPSPYRNTRPGVAYVGDASCAKCHAAITETYRRHPMGRSIGAAAEPSPGRPVVPETGVSFEAGGWTYEIKRQGDRVTQKETRRDGDGKVLAEVENEVAYVLGSGTRGTSYLVDHDGYLFQAPASWYTQQAKWDLAPGYREANAHFGRTIEPGCVFCHTDRVEPVKGPENRYRTGKNEVHAIGCERCHGPGELHVKDPATPYAIVNPADLTPELRESVCQQCHLQGAARIVRGGHETYDYRPGLPYREFWAVFQKNVDGPRDFKGVGHVEQMESSRCFLASDGRLGCVSCHDPHALPPDASKIAYFRDRCLECHADKGCSAPQPARLAKGDDCASCHMPRSTLVDIAHTAATDHRIIRTPDAPPATGPKATGRPEFPIVDYHEGQMDDAERTGARRDLGVALTRVGLAMGRGPESAMTSNMALPLLKAALDAHPDDRAAREAEGSALRLVGKPAEALGVFDAVVKAEPGRESALRLSASTAAELGKFAESRRGWESIVAVNPWRAEYHVALAAACDRLGDWDAAARACRSALRLNPALTDARSLLVRAELRAGHRDRADAEVAALVRFAPASRAVWQAWYDRQKAEAGR